MTVGRVTLADEKDALGLPRPRVHDEVDAYTQDGLTAAKALHDRLFKALRATDCGHGETFEGAGHIMGTCRMGSDPRTSVTDPQCRSHDHKNLFIPGSSVFCTTGAAEELFDPPLGEVAFASRGIPPWPAVNSHDLIAAANRMGESADRHGEAYAARRIAKGTTARRSASLDSG